MEQIVVMFLISDFRHDLNTVYLLLGISPASNCSWPTFWNPVSVPSSKTGCTVYTQPLKMELIQGSETSANYNLTLGKYPEENIQQSQISVSKQGHTSQFYIKFGCHIPQPAEKVLNVQGRQCTRKFFQL